MHIVCVYSVKILNGVWGKILIFLFFSIYFILFVYLFFVLLLRCNNILLMMLESEHYWIFEADTNIDI